MEQEKSLAHSWQAVTYFIVLVIGIIIGLATTQMYTKQQPIVTENVPKAGIEVIKNPREDGISNPYSLGVTDGLRMLSGVVTEVSGNRITLHLLEVNPFEKTDLNDRTILVAGDTKISVIFPKDSKILSNETDAFIKIMQQKTAQGGNGVSQLPPDPFTHTASSLQNITIGKTIIVTAKENITKMKEFTASNIDIPNE